jgi:oligosaccharide repeat unit polymerase
MIWWYGTFLVVVYTAVALLMRAVDPSWRRLYHPWVIVGGLNILYTLTPLSSPVIRSEQEPALAAFLLVQLVGIIGLGVGTLAAYAVWPNTARSSEAVRAPLENLVGLRIATLIFVGLWLLTFQIYEDGIARVFLQGYHDLGTYTTGADVLAYALTTYPLLALVIVGYFVRGASWDVVIAGGLFAVLNLLGGHRNLFMMELGGFLAVHSLRSRRPSYLILGVGGVCGFFLLMFIGAYRGFGAQGLPLLISILKEDGLRVFDPSTQELGTSFNVFRIYWQNHGAGFEHWIPGESYVRAFLSALPRVVWPDRPVAIANYFSDMFAPTGEGLGFSYNLEAYISAGTPGVLLAMTILGFLVTGIYIKQCSRRITLFGLSFYSALLFISFNLNRIDFQTVLKIGALLIGAQYFVLRAFARKPYARHASQLSGAPTSDATVR